MNEKNYINGMIIRKKEFENGGSLMNVSIKVNEFIEQLQKIQDEHGWAKLVIAGRKTPSDKGVTHYVYEDTFKPKQQTQTTVPQEREEEINIENIPF